MDSLAGYTSDEGDSIKCMKKKSIENTQVESMTQMTNSDLMAEWESFEKLIMGAPENEKNAHYNDDKSSGSDMDICDIPLPSFSDIPVNKSSSPQNKSKSSSSSKSPSPASIKAGSPQSSSSSSSPEKKADSPDSSSSEDEQPKPKSYDTSKDVRVIKSLSPKRQRSRSREHRKKLSRSHRSGSRNRSHSRLKSKDRKFHKHDRRHSPHSRRDKHKSERSHSRDRHRRPRHDRNRDHRRSRSRSPFRRHFASRRPRSRSPLMCVPKKRNEPLSFKEQLKASLMEVQKKAASSENDDGKVTPQEALLRTMQAMHQKAQELTGVAVPKYYNPAAVNPLKYAEQVTKRKLLWSGKKTEAEKADKTESVNSSSGDASQYKAVLPQDANGAMSAKFRKLMGIKDDTEGSKFVANEDTLRKQDELYENLDKEYTFARMTTHTHRGVGLGYASATGTQVYFPK